MGQRPLSKSNIDESTEALCLSMFTSIEISYYVTIVREKAQSTFNLMEQEYLMQPTSSSGFSRQNLNIHFTLKMML